jgi:secreted PhoX family phosphatase
MQRFLLVAASTLAKQSEIDRWWKGEHVGHGADQFRELASIFWQEIGVPEGTEMQTGHVGDVRVNGHHLAQNYRYVVQIGKEWRDANPYEGDTFGILKDKNGDHLYEYDPPFTGDCVDDDTGMAAADSSVTNCAGAAASCGSGAEEYCPVTCELCDATTGESLIGGKRLATDDGKFSSMIDMATMIWKDGKLYMVVHQEHHPGTTYFLEVDQDASTGVLTLKKCTNMDWSAYGGLHAPCAGSLSPWNTHIGSEEWGMETKEFSEANFGDDYDFTKSGTRDPRQFKNFLAYHGLYPDMPFAEYKEKALQVFSPYHVHWFWEAGPDSSAKGYFNTKHYAMGRRSGELPYCMPDKKTVYMTDDSYNGFFSKFVADTAEDLSAGELFCAKLVQKTDAAGNRIKANAGEYDITWRSMGKATNADFTKSVLDNTKFTDLFDEIVQPSDATDESWCTGDGYRLVNKGKSDTVECLKLKTGQEKFASRFEARRYAGYIGCTLEISRAEGFTYSADSGKAYMGVTTIQRTMEGGVGKYDVNHDAAADGGDIVVDKNICGCVFELGMDDSYSINSMKGLVCGTPLAEEDALGNECDLAGIANPDNVASVHGHGAILIAEDTSKHVNNIMWKYDLDTGALEERVGAVPTGAEVCSPYFFPDINGFSYLAMVVQHPDSESAAGGHQAGFGYAVWPRDCSTSYPAWSMPGGGTPEATCVAHADKENANAAWQDTGMEAVSTVWDNLAKLASDPDNNADSNAVMAVTAGVALALAA